MEGGYNKLCLDTDVDSSFVLQDSHTVQLSCALRKASCGAGLSRKWPDVWLAVRAGADSGFCPFTLHIRPRGNLLALIFQSSSGLLTAGRIPTQCSDLEKTNFLVTWGFGAIDRV